MLLYCQSTTEHKATLDVGKQKLKKFSQTYLFLSLTHHDNYLYQYKKNNMPEVISIFTIATTHSAPLLK